MTDQVEHVELALDDDELARLLGTSVEALARERAGFDLVHKAAANIRAARLHRGLTQKQLAEKLGVTVGRISQYETGDLRHAPSLRVLAEIAHVLGMSVGIFLVPNEASAAVSPVAASGPSSSVHFSRNSVASNIERGDEGSEFTAALEEMLDEIRRNSPEEKAEPLPSRSKAVTSGRQ